MAVEPLETIAVATELIRDRQNEIDWIKSIVMFPNPILIQQTPYNTLVVSTYSNYRLRNAATVVYSPASDEEIGGYSRKHTVEDSLRVHADVIDQLKSLYFVGPNPVIHDSQAVESLEFSVVS